VGGGSREWEIDPIKRKRKKGLRLGQASSARQLEEGGGAFFKIDDLARERISREKGIGLVEMHAPPKEGHVEL